MAQQNTWTTVTMIDTMNVLRSARRKLISAPEPPAAMASSVVAKPSARSNPPHEKSAGSRLRELLGRASLLDSAVRSDQ